MAEAKQALLQRVLLHLTPLVRRFELFRIKIKGAKPPPLFVLMKRGALRPDQAETWLGSCLV